MRHLKFIFILFWASTAACVLAESEPPGRILRPLYTHYLNAMILERQGYPERALEEYNRTLELLPNSKYLYRMRAQLALRLGDSKTAIKDLQKSKNSSGEDVETLLILGNAQVQENNYPAAQKTFEKILQLEPKQKDALLSLGTLQIESNPARAAEYFEALLKISPDNIDGLFNLAIVYQKLNREAEAEKLFAKVAETDPKSAQGLVLLGQKSLLANRREEAMNYFEEALAMMPQNFPLRLQLVLLYSEKKDFAAVEALLEQYKTAPDAPAEALLWLGSVYENRKDWGKAADCFERMRKKTPNFQPEMELHLAGLYGQMNQPQKAYDILQKLCKSDPQNRQYRFFLALALDDLGDRRKALAELEQILKTYPNWVPALFQRGVVQERMGNYDEAVISFFAVIKIDTANAPAYNYLGYTAVEHGNNLFQARRWIERALELDQNNPAYLDSLGWLLYHEGKYPDALRQLSYAAEQLPDPTVYEHLGETALALKKIPEAVEYFKTTLKLNPKSKKARERLEELQENWFYKGSDAWQAWQDFQSRSSTAPATSGVLAASGKAGFLLQHSGNLDRGFFYLARSTKTIEALRLDWGAMPMAPSLSFRFAAKNNSWKIFPSSTTAQTPPAVLNALQLWVKALDATELGQLEAAPMKLSGRRAKITGPQTSWEIDLGSKELKRVSTAEGSVTLLSYQKLDGKLFPRTLKFEPADSAQPSFIVEMQRPTTDAFSEAIFHP